MISWKEPVATRCASRVRKDERKSRAQETHTHSKNERPQRRGVPLRVLATKRGETRLLRCQTGARTTAGHLSFGKHMCEMGFSCPDSLLIGNCASGDWGPSKKLSPDAHC